MRKLVVSGILLHFTSLSLPLTSLSEGGAIRNTNLLLRGPTSAAAGFPAARQKRDAEDDRPIVK